jgi:hypothetical protein
MISVMVVVLNTTFNNTLVISWRRKPEYSEKTIDLPQVTYKLYHIMSMSEGESLTNFIT